MTFTPCLRKASSALTSVLVSAAAEMPTVAHAQSNTAQLTRTVRRFDTGHEAASAPVPVSAARAYPDCITLKLETQRRRTEHPVERVERLQALHRSVQQRLLRHRAHVIVGEIDAPARFAPDPAQEIDERLVVD